MTNEEFKQWRKTNTKVVHEHMTEQQLMDYTLRFKSTWQTFPENNLHENHQIHLHVIPNYGENESAVFFSGHHVYFDGLSMTQAVHECMDSCKTDRDVFMKRKPVSAIQWAIIYILLPYLWVVFLYDYLRKADDKNCIKKDPYHMNGDVRSVNSKVLSVKKIKAISKKDKVTFNDIMMAVSSTVLKKYFESRGDRTGEVSVTCPFSFKTMPENPKDYVYENDFCSLTVYLPLEQTYKEALSTISAMNKKLRTSLIPAGAYLFMKAMQTFCSSNYCDKLSRNSGSKHTLLYSNFCTFIKPVGLCGSPLKKQYYSGTGTGNIGTSITSVSVLKRTMITLTSDTSQIEDVPAVIELFNKEFEALGVMYDEKEEGED